MGRFLSLAYNLLGRMSFVFVFAYLTLPKFDYGKKFKDYNKYLKKNELKMYIFSNLFEKKRKL